MSPLARQLRWLIAVRLVVITSILLPYFLLNLRSTPAEGAGESPAQTPPALHGPGGSPPAGVPAIVVDGDQAAAPGIAPAALYTLAGLTYLASLIYLGLLRLLAGRHVVQAYVQFGGDLLLITALVFATGGITSPFSIFYLVVIAVASTLLQRRAGFTVATAAYALYAGLLLGLYLGWAPTASAFAVVEPAPAFRLIYNLVVNLIAFYAVAVLTSALAYRTTRAEHELEQKREDLADLQMVHRDVIQSINSGLITTDLDGIVTSVNRAGEEILGTSAAALVGRPVQGAELLSAEHWAQLTRDSAPDRRQRSDVEIHRGGRSIYVGFSLSQLADAEGTQRGYIVIFQDLTRWRELQEEVRLKDRMAAVGELAAGIAHEIGNPLAAISGSVQMLARSPGAGADSDRRLVEILLKESQRLDRTIKGFLRFARPRERATEVFDVAALLAENFELLRNSAEITSAHHLELDLDPPAARLMADPDQISQIFWNLVRNALKAMPAGGTLRVVGKLSGDRYRLRFSDSGHGMAAEERTNLFHPFKSFFDRGSGIGMAIVYRIVQEHQGMIRVDSRPGTGTTIAIELPVAGAAQPLAAEVAAP